MAIICRIALGAGDTTVARLVNAYAILANQGRSVKPTTIDYVQDRNGKVIYRTDNRCAVMGNCNAPDWDGKAMPRPPSRTRQLLDPMAAFQMVHIMEGVIIRGTATVLRDLNRPLFGKTGTTNGPDQRLVRRRNAGHRRRRLPGLRPAAADGRHGAQGGRIAAPVWKQWAQTALKDQPKVPFVAPPGIRWVRIDRATGKAVFGVFPTQEDPKSPVIWEAFQPQTEPRRSCTARWAIPCDRALSNAAGRSRSPRSRQRTARASSLPLRTPQLAQRRRRRTLRDSGLANPEQPFNKRLSDLVIHES